MFTSPQSSQAPLSSLSSSTPHSQESEIQKSDTQASKTFPEAQSQHILVLGGGLIGTAIALELRLRGCKVTVLSRDRREAAGYAAAGMLAPQAEKLSGAMLELCIRSRDLYPQWVAQLESLAGRAVGYWASGILNPVYELSTKDTTDSTPENSSRNRPKNKPANRPEKASAQWLDAAAILTQQPNLGPEVIGGWWFPQDAQVDNRRHLLDVLHEAIAQAGVHWKEGVSVERVEAQNKQIQAIHTNQGNWQADHYIWATGAWAGSIPGLELPVYPRKGQLLSLRPQLSASSSEANPASEAKEQPLKQVLYGDYVYIVPRQDGLIVVGATVEDVAFASGNTAAGIQLLLNEAIRLYPPLKDFELVETWWGYRPATPDELPILGPSPFQNLTLATGHYRNGVLLTPITAQLIANWVLGAQESTPANLTATDRKELTSNERAVYRKTNDKTDPLMAAFRWDRFTK